MRSAQISAAAYGHHDLQLVTRSKHYLAELAARHNLAVAFHGDAFACEVEVFDQCSDIQWGVEAVAGAVDGNLDHGAIWVIGKR